MTGEDGTRPGQGRAGDDDRKYVDAPEPIIMDDPVWGTWEFPDDEEPSPLDILCWSACPCCIHGYVLQPCWGGRCKRPGMTTEKVIGWRRFLLSWCMLFSLAQISILSYSIWGMGSDINAARGVFLGPSAVALLNLGAKHTKSVLEEDEWYRIAAPMFLHGGFLHLVMNLTLQIRTAVGLEVTWGHTRFVTIYVGSGIYSFYASCLLLPEAISVGCSGAIMGVIGAWFVFSWITWSKERDLLSRVIELFYAGTSIAIVVSQSWLPNVDWACHIGGLLAGVALAMVLFASELKARRKQIQTIASGLVLLAGLVTGVTIPLLQMNTDKLPNLVF